MNNTEERTALTEQELKLINRYTRRRMTEEELYAFPVVLCDNEVDRDFERFTVDALRQLSELFLGKTGIFDHSAKSSNQSARIYDTYLEEDPERLTEDGEVYTRLVAKAYLPKSEATSQLILEIDSGMKKEVSVGCAVKKRVCSICGAEKTGGGCGHRKGEVYRVHGVEKRAHDILSEVSDAYEWSFVAVPAQKDAGVIKSFGAELDGAFSLEKWFDHREFLTLTKTAASQLQSYIQSLEHSAQSGQRYREKMENSVCRLSNLVQPEIPGSVMERFAKSASLQDLETLENSLQKRASSMLPMKPQLWNDTKQPDEQRNQEFKI